MIKYELCNELTQNTHWNGIKLFFDSIVHLFAAVEINHNIFRFNVVRRFYCNKNTLNF